MDPSPQESGSGMDERIDALVDEYFDRKQAGEDITPESFATEHEDLAEELRPYLVGLSILHRMDTGEDGVEAGAGSSGEDSTLPSIAGYEVREEIGSGGMGVVYKALQVATKRIVAIKVVLAGPFTSESAQRRFQREVELAARLQHPSIVRVLESGGVERRQYYAMDYVEGVPLDDYLSKAEPDREAILKIFMQICEAVEYAHEHGVVHRDLKPANVLIDEKEVPHVLDFGLAKALDEAETDQTAITRASAPGQVMGTLPYLSPEQAAGAPEAIDARTDVYSLGVMLYEVVTGSLPYDVTGRPSDVIRHILEDSPTPPSSFPHKTNGELDTIVLKALEKEKARRYQSAKELGEDLRRYLEGEPILARRPSSLYILRKKLLKHRVAAAAVALMLVIAVVAAGIRWHQARVYREDLAKARWQLLGLQGAAEKGNEELDMSRAVKAGENFPELLEAPLVIARGVYADGTTRRFAIPSLERELREDPTVVDSELRVGPAQWALAMLLADMYEKDVKDTLTEERSATAKRLREDARQLAPDTPEAWYVRSFATFDPKEALRCAEEAARRQPSNGLAWARVATLREIDEDFAGALEACNRILESRSMLESWLRTWRQQKALNLIRLHRYEEALDVVSGMEATMIRALVFMLTGEYEKAVEEYNILLARVLADEPWYYYQRATPEWILGRHEDALEDYRRVREQLGRPSYGDARRFLILRHEGRHDEAKEVLDAALGKLDDMVGFAWLEQICKCLDGQITPEKLIEEAEGGTNPEHECEAYYYAAEFCLLKGRQDEAEHWFRKCVETDLILDPNAGVIMNEWELARWRLSTLFADAEAPTPEKN